MNKMTIAQLKTLFDSISQRIPDSNVEFWFARELMSALGYGRWENFSNVIRKATVACETVGASVDNHFRGVTKMVEVGSGAKQSSNRSQ